MTANNDSADLEALFDSIAATYVPEPPAPAAPAVAVVTKVEAVGDSDDLQALFDSVVAEVEAKAAPAAPQHATPAAPAGEGWSQRDAVYNRIGQMARSLHDTLAELGYDKLIEKTVSAIPDAKDRLAYVANLTEQAACRVLNATDIAGPIVDEMESSAQAFAQRWDQAFAAQLTTAEFRQLAVDTRAFMKEKLPQQTRATHAQLTEIMMAQDFQDLTGQVIKKIVALAQDLESGLMSALIELVPEGQRTGEVASLMNGPVIKSEGRTDVVINQEQVDDLLDSLGF